MTGALIIYKGNNVDRLNKAVEIINASLLLSENNASLPPKEGNETTLPFGNGVTAKKRLTLDQLKSQPDMKFIQPENDKKSIGIKQIKEGISFLTQRPLSLPIKALILNPAEYLTTDAQNAMLKILEEPPSYALILLLAKTQDNLLQTVQSRCKNLPIMHIKNVPDEQNNINNDADLTKILTYAAWKLIVNSNIHTRMEIVEELAKEDREAVVKILETWVHEERQRMLDTIDETHNMLQKDTYKYYACGENIKLVLSLLDDFESTNVGLRLGLELLMLGLK